MDKNDKIFTLVYTPFFMIKPKLDTCISDTFT